MSSRERILAIIVGTIVVVAGGGFLVQTLFLSPLKKSSDAVAALQDQIDKKMDRIKEIQAEAPLLERWKALTLPSKVGDAQLAYDQWLTNLVQRDGFTGASVTPKPVNLKDGITATGPAAAKATPVFAKYGFSVTGRATLANLVGFLYNFYSTGLLHQVRSISIQRPQTTTAQQRRNELDITLSIEALSLTNVDSRKTLLTPIDPRMLLVATVGAWRQAPIGLAFIPDALGPRGVNGPGKLAREDAAYAEIAKKDIFIGKSPGVGGPDVDPYKYFKLTDISEAEVPTAGGGVKRSRQANMFDLYNNRRVHLQVEKSSASTDFAVRDEGYNILYRGTVVKINDLDIIFQELSERGTPVKDKYFRIKVGGSMQEAFKHGELTKEQIAREGLATAASAKPIKEAAAEEDQEQAQK